MRVLDVGCGPGRHAHALGRLGIAVHGVDISQRFIEIARTGAPDGVTVRAPRRAVAPASTPSSTPSSRSARAPSVSRVAAGRRPSIRHGRCSRAWPRRPTEGAVALTAFSSYFQVKYLQETTAFAAETGVAHERTTIKDEEGRTRRRTSGPPASRRVSSGSSARPSVSRSSTSWSVGPRHAPRAAARSGARGAARPGSLPRWSDW